ncbi:PTS system oligo-beta-mannoside-specific EIIC component [Sebaldella termitidis]|uniref:Permease IIC component n=1 Tax=Sebaldella termitidis (strain ATCC 33386 / NCTC 11300) TaxID=526218 RepID=D1APC9_SEBTE|nr:PTS transporter subunit EIIC [Sebaldella termitidis]ACZ09963.1 PTS system, lactose/cellobiose family IIC subunit [Sebaldella termitidis ATCC 33386]SUI25295.1 PTS system oligo-beta-mannoside-specific EIIC component [Sebaldella termitidis]
MSSGSKKAFSEILLVFAEKIGKNIYLLSLRDAFMLSFPLTMFGSILLVISNFPLISAEKKDVLWKLFGHSVESSMLLMSIFISLGIGYYLYKYKNPEKPSEALYSAAVALTSFFIVTPFSLTLEGENIISGVIPTSLVGAQGLFVAIIISILSTTIYSFMINKNIIIKMPKEVPPAIAKSFSAIIPGAITLTTFMIISLIFERTSFHSIHSFVYEFLQKPLIGLGTSFAATMIAVFLVQFFWFFGIHGHLVVNPIMDTVWNVASLENLNAYNNNLPLPHIVTKQFVEMFTVSVGSMGALSALTAIFLVSKIKQQREVAKLGFIPGIFNIAEPTLFGLPVILNPIMAIPWMLGGPLTAAIAYFATVTGIMPKTTGVAVPWTMPLGISGTLATNSIMGGVVQVICFIAVVLLWIPFILYSQKEFKTKEQNT